MRQAVFDTNVIVSGFLSPHGPPGRIVEWLREGAVTAVVDDRIAGEYADVLARARFGLPANEVGLVLRAIMRHAQRVTVRPGRGAVGLPDTDDAPFLDCAAEARVPLVTGNTRHYPAEAVGQVRVMSPADFVAEVNAAAVRETGQRNR